MTARYQTIDIKTGEIVAEQNGHPMLDPLRRRQSARVGLRITKRPIDQSRDDLSLLVVLCGVMLGVGAYLWAYAWG